MQSSPIIMLNTDAQLQGTGKGIQGSRKEGSCIQGRTVMEVCVSYIVRQNKVRIMNKRRITYQTSIVTCIMLNAFITILLSMSSSNSRIHRPIINEYHNYLVFSLSLVDPSINPNLVTIFFASSSENFTFVSLGILPSFCCFAHSSRIR